MTRRAFIALAGGVIAWPSAAGAQKVVGLRKIGVLMPFRRSDHIAQRFFDAFANGLQELGWFEGKTIAYDVRFSEGDPGRLPSQAAELVEARMDVLVVYAAQAVDAARDATRTIPIVVPTVGDMLGGGYVASLARPGGNITGISLVATEQSTKRLQLLKELPLNVTRVAALWNRNATGHQSQMKELGPAAPKLGIELLSHPVTRPDEIDGALHTAVQANAQALMVMEDPMIQSNRVRIAEFAIRQKWPAIGEFGPIAADGALMSYGPNLVDLWRRTAGYVDKILKGANPADLPVEQPNKYDLVINLKTAKAIGLDIPQLLFARATEVIE
jgi:putative tryptophan/tyrosine transport system substrate-binding protein